MTAIDSLFADLRSRNQKALMPFITAGDPDLDFTSAMLAELVKRGAHLCELGIPYSDPIADGPVVQASYTRALAKKVKLHDILEMAQATLPRLASPVVTMVSYAIVYRHGLEQYVADAQAAGVAGAIVPDLPVEEAERLARICQRHRFSLIQLVTPTTPRERAVRIANSSTGFLYYVSVIGITGERASLPPDLLENVAWLRRQTPLPVCIGFGISQPEHVRMLAPVADGLIVGSAIVKRIAGGGTRPRQEVISEVGDYVTTLLNSLSN